MIEQSTGFWVGQLEIRQEGQRPILSGSFGYNQPAVIADRGRIRKESFMSRAFKYAIEDVERDINVLVGHSYDRPLASRSAGTLDIVDGDDAVRFEAALPPGGRQPTWVDDAVKAVEARMMRGISPGFAIPPPTAVQNAVSLLPESKLTGIFGPTGRFDATVRYIREAVLHEMSLVTRPAYKGTSINLRSFGADGRLVTDGQSDNRRPVSDIERRARVWA